MIKSYRTLTHVIAFFVVGVFLTGCGSTSQGGKHAGARGISYASKVSARIACNYEQAQNRALRLLDRRQKRRAAMVLAKARNCMRNRTYRAVGRR